jgi:glycosidase
MKRRDKTPAPAAAGMFEQIPLARGFRDRYGFKEEFRSEAETIRRLSRLMSERRGLPAGTESTGVSSARLEALALIEETLRYLAELYVREANPRLLSELEARLRPRAEVWDRVVRGHVRDLPPARVYSRGPRGRAEQDYLEGMSRGVPHRSLELMQVIMLWLAVRNPAYRCCPELFDDTLLQDETGYRERVAGLRRFFEDQPHFGPDNQNLLDLLAAPALASPDSLFGQLEYMRLRWGGLLGDRLERLLRGLDMLREEEKPRTGGAGPVRVSDYRGAESEAERYSPDGEWMPGLVMIAKSCLVWLSQLSRTYRRPIRRLDEIPTEELARLAGWGISGLWLIGIWERSAASRAIKRSCGNPEAEASAYSLRAYTVAEALGGPSALAALKDRCGRYGIRLASDMVPNHTGLDSPWLAEHPDWYVNLPASPFPAYTFRGRDLSDDSRFSAMLEDHYYDRSDAAVVFRWQDRRDGTVRYVYHGNDGTHLPWNDTAQLNYLVPELREAVIRTILEVARQFPIIRFDAAMTLTRKHFQRLWFPPPGEGGDIPSRSQQGLSREQFDRAMPAEFWREVVDRVAAEAPDTLLLAEAFWLMEGYFVRTLGMHRVYNSAFMNMLKTEENGNYRLLVKKTLSFDPRILARYVNFMNNPDEETAVAQFGKGDKYFGACVLMVTMPGLPMFGHGQVEGFQEKYGMEYARAYREEDPDPELVSRHEREIFPLLARRALFAGVDQFRFYDLLTSDPDGEVDENVFAYSNRRGAESALVLFNNRYRETRGRILTSVRFADLETGKLRREQLFGALGLEAGEGEYVIFRDLIGGLEYIRSAAALRTEGLAVELHAFQYQVFSGFRRVGEDDRGTFGELTAYLNGRGVPDLNDVLAGLRLRPLHAALAELLAARSRDAAGAAPEPTPRQVASAALRDAGRLRELAGEFLPPPGRPHRIAQAASPRDSAAAGAAKLPDCLLFALVLLTAALEGGELPPGEAAAALRLEPVLIKFWRDSGTPPEQAARLWLLLRALLEPAGRPRAETQHLKEFLKREEVKQFLEVHAYDELLYFRKEHFETLLAALEILEEIALGARVIVPAGAAGLAEEAGYRFDLYLELLDG